MSTYEAEFVSMSIGAMKVIGQHKLLEFVLGKTFFPIDVFCDNTAAINIVEKENTMAIQHNYEKNADYIILAKQKGRVNVMWVDSEQQPADIFTKALNAETYTRFRDFIFNKCDGDVV